ncbi:MAG TPA: hypothetical protein VLT85_13430 [Terriglobales bacterium]|nr:hypothetical protein [Terriglobales bacterium]HXZ27771.1 hypothetical protein [Terriglobales bacterium]
MERFAVTELTALRSELLEGGLDHRQAGEMLQMFMMGHGFGVSPDAAMEAAGRVGSKGCSLEAIQHELENLALVM